MCSGAISTESCPNFKVPSAPLNNDSMMSAAACAYSIGVTPCIHPRGFMLQYNKVGKGRRVGGGSLKIH